MQTFMPYSSFQKTAACLDYRRLGKQRVETKQIYNAIRIGVYKGWVNHPATKMWEGYEAALCLYGIVICTEWLCRGYDDSLLPFFHRKYLKEREKQDLIYPPWIRNTRLIRSHRSNLMRKDPVHYIQFGWNVPTDLPYVWPTKEAA